MRSRRLVSLLVAAALAAGAGQAAPTRPLEAAVKATFLPKFVPYVSWPPPAAPAAGGVYQLCVVGRDPFGSLLDDAALGERIGGSSLTVRRLDRLDRGAGCHLAFIGGSAGQSVAAALDAVEGIPILTVTDARGSRERGMVHFDLKGGRVRFHIDDAAAARAGLGLSSKLLGLALSVRQRGRG